MIEVNRDYLDENYYVVDLKSNKINSQKDLLDFLLKIISDKKFEMTEILVKDYGDKDTWDQYENHFYEKKDLLNIRDELDSLDLNSIKIKGFINGNKCTFFLINQIKVVRYGSRNNINFIKYFESLGY